MPEKPQISTIKFSILSLYNLTRLRKIPTKLRRGTILLFLETPVKIGQVIKPAIVTNLGDGLCSIGQFLGCHSNAHIVQIFDKTFAGSFSKETAKSNFTHINKGGDFGKLDFLVVIFMKI